LPALAPHQSYHLGFRGGVSHSTLSDANQSRDWRIDHDLAQGLIERARRRYAGEPFGVELAQTVYALDSTTSNLCLMLFPWARFRRAKAAIKRHTLLVHPRLCLDFRRKEGRCAGVGLVVVEAGAFYVMDRGYADFARRHRFVGASAFYVTPAKRNLQFHRVEALPVETGSGVVSDQRIAPHTRASRQRYPDPLRRVHYVDPATGKSLVFLTNHFDLPARVIAALSKSRWRVELFFKWIKQNLRVRHFFGQSGNAVRTQIGSAIAGYVLVAVAKKQWGGGAEFDGHPANLQCDRVFEKTSGSTAYKCRIPGTRM